MKILQLLPALEQGGVETVVCDLSRVVVGNGWESVVVSKGGRLVARIESDGGRHVKLDVKSKNPLTYPIRAWQLRRIIQIEKPDLVCVHSRVPAWLYVGVRTLDSLIRRFVDSTISPPWLTYAHGANSVSRYSAVMTKGDLTVVPSRFLADFLKANYGLAEEKIRIIHPAVDARRFDPGGLDRDFVERKRREWGLSPEDFVVMAVGRITPVKGYDELIRSVAKLLVQVPNLKLVIVGDADRRHQDCLAELKSLASSLVPSSRADATSASLPHSSPIIFAGGESKIPECLSLASVVVSANTRKPESFGLSMAEALTMGKPVVAKAFGGACEVVRDGIDGILVHDGDFAAALLAVRARSYGDVRSAAVDRFGAGTMVRNTLELYGQIVGKTGI